MELERVPVVAFAGQNLGDRRDAEAESAQQQHPLQPHEGVGVVVPVPVAAHPARRHEARVVVMTQGAARGARKPGDLLDAPLHVFDGRT